MYASNLYSQPQNSSNRYRSQTIGSNGARSRTTGLGVHRAVGSSSAAQRVRGYYSLPLLWRDKVIGWSNVSVVSGTLVADIGFVSGPPSEPAFASALDAELAAMGTFLGLC